MFFVFGNVYYARGWEEEEEEDLHDNPGEEKRAKILMF